MSSGIYYPLSFFVHELSIYTHCPVFFFISVLLIHKGLLYILYNNSLFSCLKRLLGDPWGAQRFSACLWPRARSWSPGIESQVGLPAWSPLLPPPVSLPLSLSLSIIINQSLKAYWTGHLGGSAVGHLPSAQGVILESQDWTELIIS